MTLKELSQLYWLTREIKDDQRRIEELQRLSRSASTSSLSGMPMTHDNVSKVERMAAEIVDLQAAVAARQILCIHERSRIERWIDGVPDSLLRQVFRCRFIDGLTWQAVADHIGGGNTAASVKMMCYRYLRT